MVSESRERLQSRGEVWLLRQLFRQFWNRLSNLKKIMNKRWKNDAERFKSKKHFLDFCCKLSLSEECHV